MTAWLRIAAAIVTWPLIIPWIFTDPLDFLATIIFVTLWGEME